jgi:hypothetical protein
MKRRFLIVLLTLGTIGGFGSGIASMRCHGESRRAAFERHVAKVCVDAARKSKGAATDSTQDESADW